MGIRQLFTKHRTLFWSVHSIWALAVGIAVLYLANENYGFVPWVVLFLALTWASTLFFGRDVAATDNADDYGPGLKREVVSYLTRSMYQETLFFLLPFYWYSTVVKSANIVFPLILAGLAIFSCIDLVFDRWLRTRPSFSIVFFATVTFAAVNLVLPMVSSIRPAMATPTAAVVAVATSLPLVLRGARTNLGEKATIGAACLVIIIIGFVIPRLVPPVPLRLKTTIVTSHLDREGLIPRDTLGTSFHASKLDSSMFLIVEVFAPSVVPTTVNLEWTRDGELVHQTREIEISAHETGFRVWDQVGTANFPVDRGRYQVILRTEEGRVFGKSEIEVL